MPDLREQLRQLLEGRACLIGVGNVDCGDDAFGVRLAEELKSEVGEDVVIAGTSPERLLSLLAEADFAHIIFLDAAAFGGAPGSIVLLDSTEMAARFPQVSTHKISLGLLARQIEANGRSRAWLLGVQPESLAPGQPLSTTVQATLDLLMRLLEGCWGGRTSPRGQEAPGGMTIQRSRGRSPSRRADSSRAGSAGMERAEVPA
jgi:hydrogenase maturation protease